MTTCLASPPVSRLIHHLYKRIITDNQGNTDLTGFVARDYPCAPREKQKVIFRNKVDEKEYDHKLARSRAQGPAVTKDGVTISVLANVGCSDDTERAMLNGAEGIGLYRLEQACLGRIAPPDTDELLNAMRHTLDAARGCTVHVRLLDAGADKPLPYSWCSEPMMHA